MKIVITTERLELRAFCASDAEGFYLLNMDPEVIKYTEDSPFKDVAAARRFIENYDHYEKFGFGRWSVYHKESNAYLGFCGLKYSPEKEEVDIGFRLPREYWAKVLQQKLHLQRSN